ncbi:hypothetical protein Bbelb_363910 [Branchiostoma belcheri]|nr:hypothetical protein Bbelb_363910 [Branchiostoma belcheri]
MTARRAEGVKLLRTRKETPVRGLNETAHAQKMTSSMAANGATTTYGKERILAKPRFVKQTQPIEDGPPNIKMEGNDRQQANKDNITRPTNLENTTSSANVVRTVEPQTSMFASAERLSK